MEDTFIRFSNFKLDLVKFWLLFSSLLTFFYIFVYLFFYKYSDKYPIILSDFILMLYSAYFYKKVSIKNYKIIAIFEYLLTILVLLVLCLVKKENVFLPIWSLAPLIVLTMICGIKCGIFFLIITIVIFDLIFFNRLNIYSFSTMNLQFFSFFVLGVIFINKIEELKNQTFLYEKLLYKNSIKDTLTDIYNRKYFEKTAKQLLEEYKKNGKKVLFLILDIDYFKTINDTFGHPVGDSVLKSVVNALKKNLNNNDLFARLGGEEFAILTDEFDEKNNIAEKLRKTIENLKIKNGDKDIQITISIGGVISENYNYEYLYKKADEALYEAKKTRNKSIVFKI